MLDRVKERTGSDLSDAELLAMIDAIVAELDARLGPVGPVTIDLGDPTDPQSRWQRTLRLPRPADTALPMTVIEIDPGHSGDAANELELGAYDYRVLHGGRTLQRLVTGPNGRGYWAPLVRVTFTPQANLAAREEATIKLIQLDLSYRGGLKSERAGDYQFTLSGDPVADREAILQSLEPARTLVMG